MQNTQEKKTTTQQRTLLTALLLSAPGPLVTGIAAMTSRSATQIADFLRRTSELVALLVSWWIYRTMQKHPVRDSGWQIKMERTANLTVAGAMFLSGTAMMAVGVARIVFVQSSGKVLLGLIIAILGLITNSWFWWRYRTLNHEQYDSVIAAQERLYQGKALVDLCVVIALTTLMTFPNHPLTRWVDAIGCIIVAIYLFYNGVGIMRKQKHLRLIEKSQLT